MKIRKFKMTAGTLTVVAMVTASMTTVIAEKCEKLDPELWNYPSCPHPGSEEWIHLKIKMNCDKDLEYHCASNRQGCDIQQCVKRVYCEAGLRPMLDPFNDTADCVPCTPDRYQTIGFWSNERSDCEHEKTKCDNKGQIECQPGSTTTDRSCRCNIHQNLALESYALHNATCCTNNDPWCYCVNFKSSCPNGTVRHDNYKCLEECPPNSFRQWNSETCYPNSTTGKVDMTTSTVKNITEFNQMTTTTHRMSTSKESPDTVVVGVLVGLIIAGLLVGLALWVWHRRKRRNNGPQNDEGQAGPLQDLMTNKGRPGKRTANGHTDGREPVDRANGHLAHVEVKSEFKAASTVSDEEATEQDQLLQSPTAEAVLSTKGIRHDLKGNTISKEGQVIVYKKCNFVNNKTTNKFRGGTGNTNNLGDKNRTRTTINENCAMGSEAQNSDRLESMESSNGRNSTGGENPENQLNPHRPEMPQQQTQEKGTESVMSTDIEPEHGPVEHEERVEQHMAKLKQHTGNDQSRIPEEISMNGGTSEETVVKWTQSNPHEITEEVRPEELQRPIQDYNNCSHDEIKKKELFDV